MYRILFFLAFWVLLACDDSPTGNYWSDKEIVSVNHRPMLLEVSVDIPGDSLFARVHIGNCDRLSSDSWNVRIQCPSKFVQNGDTLPIYTSSISYSVIASTRIPIDDDHHLKFDILDSGNAVKSYDIDLSTYIDGIKVQDGKAEVPAENGTSLTFEKDLPIEITDTVALKKFFASDEADSVTVLECYIYAHNTHGVNDSLCNEIANGDADCSYSEYDEFVRVAGYRKDLTAPTESDVWKVPGFYSEKRVIDSLVAIYGDSLTLFSKLAGVSVNRDGSAWAAHYELLNQSSFETDEVDLTITYFDKN